MNRWRLCNEEPDIAELKASAGRAYLRFHAIAERLDYDCGFDMLKAVSPDAAEAANTFNQYMIRLEGIDATCPKGVRL